MMKKESIYKVFETSEGSELETEAETLRSDYSSLQSECESQTQTITDQRFEEECMERTDSDPDTKKPYRLPYCYT